MQFPFSLSNNLWCFNLTKSIFFIFKQYTLNGPDRFPLCRSLICIILNCILLNLLEAISNNTFTFTFQKDNYQITSWFFHSSQSFLCLSYLFISSINHNSFQFIKCIEFLLKSKFTENAINCNTHLFVCSWIILGRYRNFK